MFITAVHSASPEYNFEVFEYLPNETVIRVFGVSRYDRIAKKLDIERYVDCAGRLDRRGARHLLPRPRDPRRGLLAQELQGLAPLAIGTTLGFIVMVGGPLTGGSFNPARWFGPALVGNEWGDVWPYLVGPIVGSLLAAAVFRFVLEPGGLPPTEPPEHGAAPGPNTRDAAQPARPQP